MGEVELFPSAGEAEMVGEAETVTRSLGEMQELCQDLFEIYFDLGLPGLRSHNRKHLARE